MFFFFKRKTSYEMRISDWSSDVCSSDLPYRAGAAAPLAGGIVFVDPRHEAAGARAILPREDGRAELGRASCRARVCQYVSISVVAVSLKQNTTTLNIQTTSCT